MTPLIDGVSKTTSISNPAENAMPFGLEVRHGTVQWLKLRAEARGKSMMSVSTFKLEGLVVEYTSNNIRAGSREPVRPPFESGDEIIVSGLTNKSGVFKVLALKIPDSDQIIGTNPAILVLTIFTLILLVGALVFSDKIYNKNFVDIIFVKFVLYLVIIAYPTIICGRGILLLSYARRLLSSAPVDARE